MLRVRGEDSRGGSLSFMESNGATWCYVIEYHATRSFAVRFPFCFVFFSFFLFVPSSHLWNTLAPVFIGRSILSKKKLLSKKAGRENDASDAASISRPFRTPRVRIYDVRISRVRISLASRERATRLMTETQEGGDPWWKKCRDSSRFYAFACDIQFTKWQSPSLARSRARKNLREEKGERATRSVPRKKS